MKKYENPILELASLDRNDIVACSFGNLPELDGNGTDTPIIDTPVTDVPGVESNFLDN